MELGPIEYVVIEFPEGRFKGEIVPEIADIVDRGLVRILDLVFVKKDHDGTVAWFEYDDVELAEAFAEIDGEADGLVSEDDIFEVADELAPGAAALFILWEDTWAKGLGRAIRDAGGQLVAGGRVPHAVAQEALASLADSARS